ncbi:MAG: crossover junction endodeoxyribonuclease RuvC [Vampirovibrionales bacterium]|nr:crossover junction endodeoxyribonuclease RuvC [Vampirovibrionales bacterium]
MTLNTTHPQQPKRPTVILGIDPGLATVGFGVIEVCDAGRFTARQWGAIKTEAGMPDAERLAEIYTDICALIRQHQPRYAGIEQIFFCKNAKTLVPVAQARGVLLMALQQSGVQILEFTPMQVKQTIAGHGKAVKKEIQEYTRRWLDLPRLPKPDDAADALGLALCAARGWQGGRIQPAQWVNVNQSSGLEAVDRAKSNQALSGLCLA